MGALPKRRTSSYRKGKRRAEFKKEQVKQAESNMSFAVHALKKSQAITK